ncbi:hypothetical protein VTJ04DRAFT_558 [Mycothermus thermophilus]|uniref:uncharacterized protein n=1 Tax=Humicola insolens TaxID=85995 RepID=UPI003741EAF9
MAAKRKRPKSLSAGRPPVAHRAKSMSRSATKALINKHHLLQKRKRQAMAKGDMVEVAAIDAEIEALGGLKTYQEASLQGQRQDRGGDSSRILMQWLTPCLSTRSQQRQQQDSERRRLSMLEVGALSTQNACSKSGHFDIVRIDLNSQGDGILQQDFMERPLPRDESERFDIISLSLVLNYVPEPKDRGEMLRRTTQFLRAPGGYVGDDPQVAANFPSLFLVLPAPCVTNSRYLDEERLGAIMESLGYVKVASKMTQRLVYYLWRLNKVCKEKASFPKKEIRSGSTRNNFAVVLS